MKSIQNTKWNFFDHSKFCIGLLIVFATFIFFFSLWSGSLYPWDEAIYAGIARETVEDNHEWLTLHRNGEPWFEKPPLFLWLIACSYKLFGVHEFSVRFWPALFGVGTTILLYYLSRALFRSHKIAFFSSLTLLGFYHFTRHARMGMMDVPLTFFILLGLFLFLLGEKKPGYYFFIGPVIAVAFMIKSFALVPLPMILILFIFLTGSQKILGNKNLLLGLFAGILICVPWHVHQYMNHGMPFINEYFVKHVLHRTTGVMRSINNQNFFYLREILLNKPLGLISLITFPYFIILLFRSKEPEEKKSCLIISLSIVTILTLYSIVSVKLPWYIIPVYPFLAVSTVVAVSHLFSTLKKPRTRLIYITCIILISIPVIKLLESRKYRTLDFRPDLKELSTAVNTIAGYRERVFFNDHKKKEKDIPVTEFYTKKRVVYIYLQNCELDIGPEVESFILLMRKDSPCVRNLQKHKSLSVVRENSTYLLFRKNTPII